jgi:ketosteroid isomerase-like protein
MAEAGTKLSLEQRIKPVRDAFEGFQRGDLKAVSDQFTDDAVWHGAGSTQFGGDHRGKQAVMQNIADYAKSYQKIEQDLHDIVANDKHVVALVTTSVTRKGKTYTGQATYVFHVNDNAKVTEVWAIGDTEQLKASLEG